MDEIKKNTKVLYKGNEYIVIKVFDNCYCQIGKIHGNRIVGNDYVRITNLRVIK